ADHAIVKSEFIPRVNSLFPWNHPEYLPGTIVPARHELSRNNSEPPLPPAVRGLFLHSARWGLLAVIVLAIHLRHAQLTRRPADQPAILASLEQVQSVMPAATAWGAIDEAHQGRSILNHENEQVGFV